MSAHNFQIIEGDPAAPAILHVPHASRTIPGPVRDTLLGDDDQLNKELDESVDSFTDLIAATAAGTGGRRPWQMVNKVSRLVVDPERFPDDPMNEHGRGAVYTRYCDGTALRAPGTDTRTLIDSVYTPYAAAMTTLTQDRLDATGRAVIIDVHSYPQQPSAFEDPTLRRPEICIGTDAFHTPDWVQAAALHTFTRLGYTVVFDEPYGGCYVPLPMYRTDPRVIAIMVEIRRDLYMRWDTEQQQLSPMDGPLTGLGEAIGALARDLTTHTQRGHASSQCAAAIPGEKRP